jgi:N-acetylmuramoyl-L-alanine amidase
MPPAPDMSKEHIVAEGEHLAGIAAAHGFSSVDAILLHPENAELRKKRANPNVLLAGDRVFIPDREAKELSAPTEQRTRFVLAVDRLALHVKVHDQGFRPIEGQAEMDVLGLTVRMVRVKDVFEGPLSPSVKQAVLRFPVSATENRRRPIKVEPGLLDPIDTLSGQQQRLNNLGYFAGFVKTGATDPKAIDPQFQWAVQEFQCDHLGNDEADGIIGKKTLAKLEQVYGS